MSTKSTQLAIMGLGQWGSNIIRVCQSMKIPITGVDPSPSVLHSVRNQYPGIPLSKDTRSVLRNPYITGVVIATPSSTHFRLAREALSKGKHVLVEKPMTQDIKEAEILVFAAKKAKRILMIDHTYLFSPSIQRVRSLIASGKLGTVFRVMSRRVSNGIIRPDSSVLWDLAPHDITIGSYLFDHPPQSARVLDYYPRDQTPLDALIEFTFPKSVTYVSHISWIMPKKERELTVIGTKGVVIIRWIGIKETLRLYPHAQTEKNQDLYDKAIAIRLPPVEPLRAVIEQFMASIRDDRPPISDAVQGHMVTSIITRLYRSMAHRPRTQTVRESARRPGR